MTHMPHFITRIGPVSRCLLKTIGLNDSTRAIISVSVSNGRTCEGCDRFSSQEAFFAWYLRDLVREVALNVRTTNCRTLSAFSAGDGCLIFAKWAITWQAGFGARANIDLSDGRRISLHTSKKSCQCPCQGAVTVLDIERRNNPARCRSACWHKVFGKPV